MSPQAPRHLQDRWGNDQTAFKQLGDRFTCDKGVFRPKSGVIPTDDDYSAIDYLIMEWDFAWEPYDSDAVDRLLAEWLEEKQPHYVTLFGVPVQLLSRKHLIAGMRMAHHLMEQDREFRRKQCDLFLRRRP